MIGRKVIDWFKSPEGSLTVIMLADIGLTTWEAFRRDHNWLNESPRQERGRRLEAVEVHIQNLDERLGYLRADVYQDVMNAVRAAADGPQEPEPDVDPALHSLPVPGSKRP